MMIKNNNNRSQQITQDQWLKVIMSLSPNGIKNLENSLRQVRGGGGAVQSSENGNSSPVSSTGGSAPSMSYRKGKTYENGRRNLKDEPVSDEEAERRYKRRERNRIAAAKCRQRRQSQIDVLQVRINGLRKSGHELQTMLRSLSREKNDLNRMLTSHNCQMAQNRRQQQVQQPLHHHDDNSNSVLSDGLVSMDTDYSFVEPIVKMESVNYPSNSVSPIVTRPSSLPLTTMETQALPEMAPLFTPCTMSFLNENGVITGSTGEQQTVANQPPLTLATGVTPTSESMYQSIGYLNLLSPSLEHVNLSLFASPCGDATQQLNTPIN